MSNELVQFDTARRALAQAVSIDEVKVVRDQAEALRQYIRQQGQGLKMQNQCAEIKLRAERRAGELLGKQGRKQGQRDETFQAETFAQPKLEDLSISPSQSHRWQLESPLPEGVFEVSIRGKNDEQANTLS